MLRRAAKSGWWQWRTRNLGLPWIPEQNAISRIQHRTFGVANVWIDKETASQRRASKIPVPRRRRRETFDERGRPVVGKHELRGGKGIERKWRDGTPRPSGRAGCIRMLDSGRLIGRHRIHMVNKYGMPKRIPRKIRMERLEKSKNDWILKRKMETDPEFKAEVEKARAPTDSGAERRLREKKMEWQMMNRYERKRAEEEKAAGEYFASPLKSERKTVMSLFGEIDVTAAKRFREIKAERRRLLGSSEKPLEIEAGDGVAEAETEPEAAVAMVEGDTKKKAKLKQLETSFTREEQLMERLRRRALKLQEQEKVRMKLLSCSEGLLALEEPSRTPEGTGDENYSKCPVAETHSEEAEAQSASNVDLNESDEREPEKTKQPAEPERTEMPKHLVEDDKFDSRVEVTLVDEIEGGSTDEDSDEDSEKWQWFLDSTKPIDDTFEGWKIARVLGTSQLLGLPRLSKTKKAKPRPRKTMELEEEDIIFTPQPHTEQELENLPALYRPEERTRSLQRQIIEKTLEEYHMILKSELHAPMKKPWTRRILKADKDDITSKKYLTPEERKASGKVDLENLGTRARFRQIQPSRELRLYIDSQLLGKRRLDEWRKAGYDVKQYSPLDNVPFHKGKDKHRIHQSVFRNPQVFVAAARELASIPPADMPEVAFVGRSNVGKSKLINALTRRYGTARTSPIPGKTISINFYALGQKLCMVDTPGFSFMYGKQEQIEQLQQLTRDYLTVREELRKVVLLIDSQWGLRQKDEEFIDFLESVHRKYMIVLTKTDKVLPLELARRATQVQDQIKECKYHVGPLLMVSALSGAGIGKLRMSIASLL